MPCGAYISYEVSLMDKGTRVYSLCEFGKVHIAAFVTLGVLYLDSVAASVRIPSAQRHLALSDGVYWSSFGGRVIDCRVWTNLPRYGVFACISEAAAYSVVFQRGLQEHLLEAAAVLSPVGVSLAYVVAQGGDLMAAGGEQAEMHRIDPENLVVAQALGVYHLKSVILLESEEVHAPLVDVGEFGNQQGGRSRLEHIVPQGFLDGYIGISPFLHGRLRNVEGIQRVRAVEDGGAYHIVVIYYVFRRMQGVFPVEGLEAVSRPYSPYVEQGVAQRP